MAMWDGSLPKGLVVQAPKNLKPTTTKPPTAKELEALELARQEQAAADLELFIQDFLQRTRTSPEWSAGTVEGKEEMLADWERDVWPGWASQRFGTDQATANYTFNAITQALRRDIREQEAQRDTWGNTFQNIGQSVMQGVDQTVDFVGGGIPLAIDSWQTDAADAIYRQRQHEHDTLRANIELLEQIGDPRAEQLRRELDTSAVRVSEAAANLEENRVELAESLANYQSMVEKSERNERERQAVNPQRREDYLRQQELLARDPEAWETLEYIAENPRYLINVLAQQLPNIAVSAAAGGITGAVARGVAGAAVRSGLSKATQAGIARAVAGSGIVASETTLGVTDATSGIIDEISAIPDDILRNHPAYANLESRGYGTQEIRAMMVAEAVAEAIPSAAMISAVTGIVGPESSLVKPLLGLTSQTGRAANMLREGAVSAVSEFVQEGGTQYAQNVGMGAFYDVATDKTQDVLEAAVTGAVVGGPFGAIGGLATGQDVDTQRTGTAPTPVSATATGTPSTTNAAPDATVSTVAGITVPNSISPVIAPGIAENPFYNTGTVERGERRLDITRQMDQTVEAWRDSGTTPANAQELEPIFNLLREYEDAGASDADMAARITAVQAGLGLPEASTLDIATAYAQWLDRGVARPDAGVDLSDIPSNLARVMAAVDLSDIQSDLERVIQGQIAALSKRPNRTAALAPVFNAISQIESVDTIAADNLLTRAQEAVNALPGGQAVDVRKWYKNYKKDPDKYGTGRAATATGGGGNQTDSSAAANAPATGAATAPGNIETLAGSGGTVAGAGISGAARADAGAVAGDIRDGEPVGAGPIEGANFGRSGSIALPAGAGTDTGAGSPAGSTVERAGDDGRAATVDGSEAADAASVIPQPAPMGAVRTLEELERMSPEQLWGYVSAQLVKAGRTTEQAIRETEVLLKIVDTIGMFTGETRAQILHRLRFGRADLAAGRIAADRGNYPRQPAPMSAETYQTIMESSSVLDEISDVTWSPAPGQNIMYVDELPPVLQNAMRANGKRGATVSQEELAQYKNSLIADALDTLSQQEFIRDLHRNPNVLLTPLDMMNWSAENERLIYHSDDSGISTFIGVVRGRPAYIRRIAPRAELPARSDFVWLDILAIMHADQMGEAGRQWIAGSPERSEQWFADNALRGGQADADVSNWMRTPQSVLMDVDEQNRTRNIASLAPERTDISQVRNRLVDVLTDIATMPNRADVAAQEIIGLDLAARKSGSNWMFSQAARDILESADIVNLRKFVDSPQANQFVEQILADAVIPRSEQAALFNRKGRLNEKGKNLLVDTIRGQIVSDASVLQELPAAVLDKLDQSIPVLLQLKAAGASWDLSNVLTAALRVIGRANTEGRRVEDYFQRGSLLDYDPDKKRPAVQALAVTLSNASSEELAQRMQLMLELWRTTGNEDQLRLTGEVDTPAIAFIKAFLRPLAWLSGEPVSNFDPANNADHAALQWAYENGGSSHTISVAMDKLYKTIARKDVAVAEKKAAKIASEKVARAKAAVEKAIAERTAAEKDVDAARKEKVFSAISKNVAGVKTPVAEDDAAAAATKAKEADEKDKAAKRALDEAKEKETAAKEKVKEAEGAAKEAKSVEKDATKKVKEATRDANKARTENRKAANKVRNAKAEVKKAEAAYKRAEEKVNNANDTVDNARTKEERNVAEAALAEAVAQAKDAADTLKFAEAELKSKTADVEKTDAAYKDAVKNLERAREVRTKAAENAKAARENVKTATAGLKEATAQAKAAASAAQETEKEKADADAASKAAAAFVASVQAKRGKSTSAVILADRKIAAARKVVEEKYAAVEKATADATAAIEEERAAIRKVAEAEQRDKEEKAAARLQIGRLSKFNNGPIRIVPAKLGPSFRYIPGQTLFQSATAQSSNVGTFDRANPNILSQESARGSISFLDDEITQILFGDNADASTAIHEFYHFAQEEFLKIVNDPDIEETATKQQLRNDLIQLAKFSGVKDAARNGADPVYWTVKAREKAARAFEQYFMEGKAPKGSGLDWIFRTMKKLLLHIYERAKILLTGGALPQNIREVFDRTLVGFVREEASYALREGETLKTPIDIKRDASFALGDLSPDSQQYRVELNTARQALTAYYISTGETGLIAQRLVEQDLSTIETQADWLRHRNDIQVVENTQTAQSDGSLAMAENNAQGASQEAQAASEAPDAHDLLNPLVLAVEGANFADLERIANNNWTGEELAYIESEAELPNDSVWLPPTPTPLMPTPEVSEQTTPQDELNALVNSFITAVNAQSVQPVAQEITNADGTVSNSLAASFPPEQLPVVSSIATSIVQRAQHLMQQAAQGVHNVRKQINAVATMNYTPVWHATRIAKFITAVKRRMHSGASADFQLWCLENLAPTLGDAYQSPAYQAFINAPNRLEGVRAKLMDDVLTPLYQWAEQTAGQIGRNPAELLQAIGKYRTLLHTLEAAPKQEQELLDAVQAAYNRPPAPDKQRDIAKAEMELFRYREFQSGDPNAPRYKVYGGRSIPECNQELAQLIADYKDAGGAGLLDEGNAYLAQAIDTTVSYLASNGLLSEQDIQGFGQWTHYTPLTIDYSSYEYSGFDIGPCMPKLNFSRYGSIKPAEDGHAALYNLLNRSIRSMGLQDLAQTMLGAYTSLMQRNDPNIEYKSVFGGEIVFANGLAVVPANTLLTLADPTQNRNRDMQSLAEKYLKQSPMWLRLPRTDNDGNTTVTPYVIMFDAETHGNINRAFVHLYANEDPIPILSKLGRITGGVAQIYTKARPLFPPINAARDIVERLTYLPSKSYRTESGDAISGAKISAQMLLFLANPANLYRIARFQFTGTSGSPYWDAYFNDFAYSGLEGGVDYDRHMIEASRAVINATIDSMKRSGVWQKMSYKARQAFRKTYGTYCHTMYSLPAVAQFVTMRRNKISVRDSAFGTTELMNLRQRGSYHTVLGAFFPFTHSISQTAGNMLHFFGLNPVALSNHPKGRKARQKAMWNWGVLAATIMGMKTLIPLIAASLANEDDEEGYNTLDSIPLGSMQAAIPLGIQGEKPGSYIKIPTGFGPIGLGAQFAIGWDRVERGRMSPHDFVFSTLLSISKTLIPNSAPAYEFEENPAAFVVSTFAPFLVQPIVQSATNTAYSGATIDYYIRPEQRASDMARPTTPEVWRELATTIYDATGGAVDVTPESVRHLVTSYCGGALQIIPAILEGDSVYGNPLHESVRQALGPLPSALGASIVYNPQMQVEQTMFYNAMDYYNDRIKSAGIYTQFTQNRPPKWDVIDWRAEVMRRAGFTPEEISDYTLLYNTTQKELKNLNNDLKKQVGPLIGNNDKSEDEIRAAYLRWASDRQTVISGVLSRLYYYQKDYQPEYGAPDERSVQMLRSNAF